MSAFCCEALAKEVGEHKAFVGGGFLYPAGGDYLPVDKEAISLFLGVALFALVFLGCFVRAAAAYGFVPITTLSAPGGGTWNTSGPAAAAPAEPRAWVKAPDHQTTSVSVIRASWDDFRLSAGLAALGAMLLLRRKFRK